MMKVMHSCGAGKEVVTTVYSRCAEKFIGQEQLECQNMAFEQSRWKDYGQSIRKDLFYRMRVLC